MHITETIIDNCIEETKKLSHVEKLPCAEEMMHGLATKIAVDKIVPTSMRLRIAINIMSGNPPPAMLSPPSITPESPAAATCREFVFSRKVQDEQKQGTKQSTKRNTKNNSYETCTSHNLDKWSLSTTQKTTFKYDNYKLKSDSQ